MNIKKQYIYEARYLSNHDGDMVMFDIDLGCHTVLKNVPVRLLGVSNPEKRVETKKVDEQSEEFVRSMLSNARTCPRGILIKTKLNKKGKSGRYLATVYYTRDGMKWIDLNQQLINKGYGIPCGR